MLHWCFNWRVLAAVGAIGIVLWLVAPAVVAPVLLAAAVLACAGCKVMLIKRIHARSQGRAASMDMVTETPETAASHR